MGAEAAVAHRDSPFETERRRHQVVARPAHIEGNDPHPLSSPVGIGHAIDIHAIDLLQAAQGVGGQFRLVAGQRVHADLL